MRADTAPSEESRGWGPRVRAFGLGRIIHSRVRACAASGVGPGADHDAVRRAAVDSRDRASRQGKAADINPIVRREGL